MVTSTLIGNKKSFAIEYSFSDSKSKIGRMRLWVNGYYIGAFEDENILSVASYSLKKFTWPEVDKDIKSIANEKDIHNQIISGNDFENGEYFLSLGEAFDDFSLIGYVQNSNFIISWELSEAPFFDYPNYPNGIISIKVLIEDFNEVVSQFCEIVESTTH